MAIKIHIDLRKIQEQLFSRGTCFFWIKNWMFLKWKTECFGPIKTRFSFWLKINFRKIASNKQVDLRKIESFVRSKCFPEDIPKVKGKKANTRILKPLKSFKIFDGHLTYKEKRRVIFDNDRKLSKPQYHFFIVIQYLFTKFELQIK